MRIGQDGLGRALARAGLLAVGLAVSLVGGGALASEMIGVQLDQAKLVRLPEGTATIVVGNPAIADVTMQRKGVVVITGHRAGRTNVIALDKGGAIISESTVTVSIATEGRVLVRRGLHGTSYDCAHECVPSAVYGDDEMTFKRAIDQAAARNKEAQEAMGVK